MAINRSPQPIAQTATCDAGVILPPETPVQKAIARMNQADANYVLVAEQQRPVGIFTACDLVRLMAIGQPPADLLLSEVMTAPLKTWSARAMPSAQICLQEMEQAQISQMPVVDEDNRIVSVVTRRSLWHKFLSDAAPRQPLETARERVEDEMQEAYVQLEQQHNDLAEAHEELSHTLQELQIAEQQLAASSQTTELAKQQAESDRQRYQDLFNLAPDGYLVTDMAGHIQEANQAAVQLLCPHQSANYLRGIPLQVFVEQTQLPFFRNALGQLRYAGSTTSFEFKIVPSQQISARPVAVTVSNTVNENNEPTSLRWLIRDITELKLAESALQKLNSSLEAMVVERTADLLQTELHWRKLLEEIQLAVLRIDSEGIVTYANPYLLKMLGCSEADAVGQNWFERFVPPPRQDDGYWLAADFRRSFARADMPLQNQNGVLSQSNGTRIINWNNTLLRDRRGNILGVMSIGEDITEHAALDRIKSEFVSVVSHELRTPLTAIHGGIKMLSQEIVASESPQGKHLLKIAADSSDRLVRLVNDILEIERLESGKTVLKKERIGTQALTQAVADAFNLNKDRAGTTLAVSDPGLELMADSDRLTQVLTNLLDNAAKFSPPNSTIWLSVELEPPEPEPPEPETIELTSKSGQTATTKENNITNRSKQPAIRFQVRDRGRGIPPEQCTNIFERFTQVDSSDSREKGGTGLGLSICRNIVEQHGGHIGVESTLGKGSCFYFTVPVGTPLTGSTHEGQ